MRKEEGDKILPNATFIELEIHKIFLDNKSTFKACKEIHCFIFMANSEVIENEKRIFFKNDIPPDVEITFNYRNKSYPKFYLCEFIDSYCYENSRMGLKQKARSEYEKYRTITSKYRFFFVMYMNEYYSLHIPENIERNEYIGKVLVDYGKSKYGFVRFFIKKYHCFNEDT